MDSTGCSISDLARPKIHLRAKIVISVGRLLLAENNFSQTSSGLFGEKKSSAFFRIAPAYSFCSPPVWQSAQAKSEYSESMWTKS
jgi:hypothetical protein